MYTSTTRAVLGEFSELQYSLSPSYQVARLLVTSKTKFVTTLKNSSDSMYYLLKVNSDQLYAEDQETQEKLC